ncbi:hypothetical protein LOD99_7668 [Oopsacas minuta]|uniref:Uncharacterized protein n=1 Tax=Oopsacas minuta TaxID=111878 RepID=A0AAV7JPJ8_9METZ|nr:hypothetical protein LOD99_7668 [Oopsacas minuta]
MSLREVLLPIQLTSTDKELDRLKRSTLIIRAVYCGTDPIAGRGSPEIIPVSIQLKDKLHYISFRPTLPGFYRLHIILEGRDYCSPVLLHILSDGTLLTSTTPTNPQSSGLVDPRPPILRTESIDADVIEPHTPTKAANGGQVNQKFSELVQAFKVVTSRHTDKSGVTIHTHKTAPPKLQSNKPFGLPDFLKRIRIRQKPDIARLVREMSSPATPPHQLRVSRSIDDLSNGSIRIGRGSVRVHEYRQQSPSHHQQEYICCICGYELDKTAVRLYSSRFCTEDFSRFYLQRNVREHFLVPVLQETYLPGLEEWGALPQNT